MKDIHVYIYCIYERIDFRKIKEQFPKEHHMIYNGKCTYYQTKNCNLKLCAMMENRLQFSSGLFRLFGRQRRGLLICLIWKTKDEGKSDITLENFIIQEIYLM